MSVIFDFFQFTGQFFGYKSAELGMFVLKVSSPNSTTFSPLQAMSHLSPPISIAISFKQLRRGHIQKFKENLLCYYSYNGDGEGKVLRS